jgi:DNA gyrase inhibitor GyrI
MMNRLKVQLEQLAPMRVACVVVTSASPEEEAVHTLLDWARPQGLLEKSFRFFGYDNCQPHPNHTYTTWLTVDQDTKPSDDIQIQEFAGGHFAVTEVQGVEEISDHWKELAKWCRENEHPFADQPGLEEFMNVLSNRPANEWRFKLYLAIKA